MQRNIANFVKVARELHVTSLMWQQCPFHCTVAVLWHVGNFLRPTRTSLVLRGFWNGCICLTKKAGTIEPQTRRSCSTSFGHRLFACMTRIRCPVAKGHLAFPATNGVCLTRTNSLEVLEPRHSKAFVQRECQASNAVERRQPPCHSARLA